MNPNPNRMKITKLPLLPTIVTIIIAIAVLTGLVLSGSPSNERLRRFDQERISDLQMIKDVAVENFYSENQRLPDSIDELMKGSSLSINTYQDPETKTSYGYQRLTETQYQLCATFSLSSDEQADLSSPMWAHGIGESCFTLKPSVKANSGTPFPTKLPQPLQ